MIRINLLSDTTGSTVGVSEDQSQGLSEKEVQKQGAMRLLMIFLFPGLLIVYEQINIPELQGKLKQTQQKLQELQTFNTKAANAVQEIKKFKEEEAKINSSIKVLERISKERLREIKILDLIQQVIPEKVWLSKIEVNDGKMLISGNALSDYDVTSFVDQLSNSVFLHEVSPPNSSEIEVEGVKIKKFEITCMLEKKE